uniref:Uncharacterized protein n=1 Tax=uncultured marine virus TaxID=186617 RepID=A0A0F7L5S6_9VIRU|nr:hypothetical protein [uncultured marine virus]
MSLGQSFWTSAYSMRFATRLRSRSLPSLRTLFRSTFSTSGVSIFGVSSIVLFSFSGGLLVVSSCSSTSA